ncbi:gamma carbonic anhydrase family protein [Aquisphaera insulae]|uniref:gamma carbonic anhydrase family protein n=1 Tax=Aquisphaera insulae TaxID=2712864 RepID=UPI0013EAA111|nr:gamma carbonic anhydrase family protein [Aquisphaera insulae]
MIEPSAFIAPGAIVMGDVHLGAWSSIWFQSVIRGDTERIRIGDRTNVQDFTMIHADPGVSCLIGSRVTVGHRVILHGCVVEDDCLIGMGAILLNRVKVGAGSLIGAGALLTERMEVPPGSLVLGSPARVIKPVGDGMRQRMERTWQHYVALARRHAAGEFPPVPATSGPLPEFLGGSAVEDVEG